MGLFQRRLVSLFSVLCLSSCASQQLPPQQLQSLEYFLRMTHDEFPSLQTTYLPSFLSHWLMPPAQAELPPEYQDAFSLRLDIDHSQQQLQAEYHFQMVIDDSSHQAYQGQLAATHYHDLMQAVSSEYACTTNVEPGWAGPSPAYIRLNYTHQSIWLYAGGERGPAGPGELRQKHIRRYLCSPSLKQFLGQTIQTLKTKS